MSRLEKDKDIIISLYESGISTNRIADQYQVNSGTIYYFLKKYGISIQHRKKFIGDINDYIDKIISLYYDNTSINGISRLLGISPPTISRILHQKGLDTSRYNDVDPNNLVIDKADKILELYHSGISINQISKQVGNSNAGIRNFLLKRGLCTKQKMYDIDLNFFKKIDSEASAWVLGWLYSDGNVMHNCWRLQIQDSDRDVLEKIKILVKSNSPIHSHINKAGTLMSELYVGRKEMVKDLINLGCIPKKSLIIKFPTEDIVPKKYLSAFVRGVYGGDGSHAHGHGYVSITGSYDFIHGLVQILPCEYSSLYQSYSCKKRGQSPELSSWEVRMSRQKEMRKFLNWIYSDATIYMNRKYQLYLDFLKDTETSDSGV